MLRREVELPVRSQGRACILVALAAAIFAFSLVLDSLLWTRDAGLADPANRASPAALLHRQVSAARRRCPDAHRAPAAAARTPSAATPGAELDLDQAEIHQQLTRQLDHPYAGVDDLASEGRYGRMNVVDDAEPPPAARRTRSTSTDAAAPRVAR